MLVPAFCVCVMHITVAATSTTNQLFLQFLSSTFVLATLLFSLPLGHHVIVVFWPVGPCSMSSDRAAFIVCPRVGFFSTGTRINFRHKPLPSFSTLSTVSTAVPIYVCVCVCGGWWLHIRMLTRTYLHKTWYDYGFCSEHKNISRCEIVVANIAIVLTQAAAMVAKVTVGREAHTRRWWSEKRQSILLPCTLCNGHESKDKIGSTHLCAKHSFSV